MAVSGTRFASNHDRRPPVQERHQLRLVAAQVGEEQFPEQAVVAVPAPVPVERDDEVVGALELVEQLLGSSDVEHGVAQRRAQLLEDRRCG